MLTISIFSGGMRLNERKLAGGTSEYLDLLLPSRINTTQCFVSCAVVLIPLLVQRQGLIRPSSFEMYKLPCNLSIDRSCFSLSITRIQSYPFINTLKVSNHVRRRTARNGQATA